ncbi:secreted containing Dystroglycan-type cadherin-like domain [Brachionus plicatilis]|uniref:Secreted containing Dystroglycan-type cadherin-like domain n=1 Tax=Brachionus plicatilis TaxID=10195 RepID=A0A3M7PKL5_BRAPC|nr:secreted containing Dystroglycan-type cadherin-like domain [Brachionus plicatilis]
MDGSQYFKSILKVSAQIKDYKESFGLIHYWPIENGTTRDLVGSKYLQEPNNTNFEPDRFGNNKSVLSFNHGFIMAPRGVYFENEFTVLLWIKLRSYQSWQRLLDFSNGNYNDSVLVSLSDGDNKIKFNVRNNAILEIQSIEFLELNKWYHLGFSFRKETMTIYRNSQFIEKFNTEASNLSLNVQREYCYFGKSFWDRDPFGDFECDEIKFFNKALDTLDIQSEYFNGYF